MVACLVVVGVYCAYRFIAWWLVNAPNSKEPPPEPRAGEDVVTTKTAPSEKVAYEILSNADPKYTVVVLHGMRDSRGSMRPWAEQLAAAGARTVLVDARGHGRSTGKVLSYGVRESLDLVDVTDALEARGLLVGKLGVLGFSCGATTAIQWAGRDARVSAVVAVAPFARMDGLGMYNPLRLPDFVVDHFVVRVGRESGFDPADAGAAPWIDKTRAPILFIHGDRDTRVVPDNSRLLLERAPPGSERLVVPELNHALMLRDADRVGGQRAKDWLDKHLR